MEPNPTRKRLTHREREIALLIADGLTPTVIARRLNLPPGTVSTAIQHIQERLELASCSEIAAWVATRRTSDAPGAGLRRAGGDR